MFTELDLANMRTAQDEHMLDKCVILSYTAGTLNEYNESDAPVETVSGEIVCGLDMRPSSERHNSDMTLITYDATLRLPIATAVKETDRIRVTKRFGETITPLTYEIVSPMQRGPSGIRLMLRKIVV